MNHSVSQAASPLWVQKFKALLELVKFEHTIFALPFALSAMVLAMPAHQWPPLQTWGLVLLAMVSARTFAMGVNRIADRHIDAKNPRTQNRPLITGRVKLWEAYSLTVGALGLLFWVVAQLPPLCMTLLPVAIGIFVLYSFMKRFSWACHLILGLALGSSAVGGWVAVTNQLSWAPICFGLAILFWVAGFDIIYACLDHQFDRKEKLYAIPACFGVPKALQISRKFHMLTVLLLPLAGVLHGQVGWGYWAACGLTTAMLIYEHQLVSSTDLSRVNEAFFNVNGAISLGVFLLICFDKLL